MFLRHFYIVPLPSFLMEGTVQVRDELATSWDVLRSGIGKGVARARRLVPEEVKMTRLHGSCVTLGPSETTPQDEDEKERKERLREKKERKERIREKKERKERIREKKEKRRVREKRGDGGKIFKITHLNQGAWQKRFVEKKELQSLVGCLV